MYRISRTGLAASWVGFGHSQAAIVARGTGDDCAVSSFEVDLLSNDILLGVVVGVACYLDVVLGDFARFTWKIGYSANVEVPCNCTKEMLAQTRYVMRSQLPAQWQRQAPLLKGF